MNKIIEELNEDHLKIDQFMTKLESTIVGSDYIDHLLEIEAEFMSFAESHLIAHHKKEEDFLYKWMIEQNKNSDKDLIRKMVNDHELFEVKARWIITEMQKHKSGNKISFAELGLEISDFVNKYKEHLNRETDFIFFIADGLKF